MGWHRPHGQRALIRLPGAGGVLAAFDSGRFQRLRRIQALQKGGHLDDRLRWLGSGKPEAA